jgi:hypothetical protein
MEIGTPETCSLVMHIWGAQSQIRNYQEVKSVSRVSIRDLVKVARCAYETVISGAGPVVEV